jgi:hypothetical protein
MKNLKKFFVFAIATAIVAGAVFLITPSLKSYAVDATPSQASGPTLKLSASAAKVYVGGVLYLEATIEGDTASNYNIDDVNWDVGNSRFRIYNFRGHYFDAIPLDSGTATITATVYPSGVSPTESNKLTASCIVTIPEESSKQNASGGGSSSSSSSSSSTPTTEVALPANITSADGKPLTMFSAVDGSNTLMTGAVGLIPSGAKLNAVEAVPTSQTFSVATAILGIWRPNAEVKKVYDFNVFSKQATAIKTLDGKVCMSLPMPADLVVPEGMVLKVYKFNDDGTITVCETLIDQGRVVWGTDSFGTFAFAVEKPAPVRARRR